ncbi:hypothetical protein C8R47DRAFT_1328029 [Mycena vitilis]|nr:hypothetical protein C8R47DRAFT_1328029 [Mycena vitilis]
MEPIFTGPVISTFQKDGNILAFRPLPPYVTIISWNDGPESHYMGNVWPEQNTDIEPARYVSAGTRWDHGGLRTLFKEFIAAYKAPKVDANSYNMVASSPTSVDGAMWYRSTTRDAKCDSSSYPDNWDAGVDVVNWAVVIGASVGDITVKVTTGSVTFTYPISARRGLFYQSTGPRQSGQQKMEVFSGTTLIAVAQGGRCVSNLCLDGIYNMNDIVVELVKPSLAPAIVPCQKPIPPEDCTLPPKVVGYYFGSAATRSCLPWAPDATDSSTYTHLVSDGA